MWWIFNPPHASHYGGVWKRHIGTIRCILGAMLLELKVRQLTHELLITLISEVAAIVNARPITALLSDIDEPLSRSHLGGSHLQPSWEDGWIWHWLSKRQSLTTVLLRTPTIQINFLNQGMLFLRSNYFFTYQSIFRSHLSPVLIQNLRTSFNNHLKF